MYCILVVVCVNWNNKVIMLPLVLKARHLSGSAFCWIDIDLPEQAAGEFPNVVEDRPTELSYTCCARISA